jgi:hypothetical protein
MWKGGGVGELAVRWVVTLDARYLHKRARLPLVVGPYAMVRCDRRFEFAFVVHRFVLY